MKDDACQILSAYVARWLYMQKKIGATHPSNHERKTSSLEVESTEEPSFLTLLLFAGC
jgi:hypothetical protein